MAIGIVKTINGVKQLVPLTTDSGQGLPLGAWTSFEDDQPRNGYLKAGTTFNQADYPALYNMLGTNVVPDKGYGLDWDNAEAITLSTSDYVVQKGGWIVGWWYPDGGTSNLLINGITVSNATDSSGAYTSYGNVQIEVKKGDIVTLSRNAYQKDFHLVPYLHPMFIKAVIGPIEDSAADQVVQNINNSRSYSTEEVNTGKKWIDGKPIYRKAGNYVNYSSSQTLDSTLTGSYIDSVIACGGTVIGTTSILPITGYVDAAHKAMLAVTSSGLVFETNISNLITSKGCRWWVEYTKTTD